MPKLNVDENQLGLEGYDPVAYFDAGPQQGVSDHTASYQGMNFRFVSAANQQKFSADPAKYAPQHSGWCGVAASEGTYFAADPKTYTIEHGKLVVFYNGDLGNTLPQWEANPVKMSKNADVHWAADDLSDPA